MHPVCDLGLSGQFAVRTVHGVVGGQKVTESAAERLRVDVSCRRSSGKLPRQESQIVQQYSISRRSGTAAGGRLRLGER